ncbi:uncharacterized protein LOC119653884 isoform X2 [Hermetia illucens]|uniref:uncharacterized protein LOC119653884 isoform X2 n=1 Tax=Hermetia illucens TaxID=343691 RepID=UPI0018CC491C|nr:uncharacterized protein LOC119653884 isoform X2 [Hermetia illucens]
MAKLSYAVVLLVLSVLSVPTIRGQQNAQFRVPSSLVECYRNYNYLYAYNRVPSTIGNLISMIQKVENDPNYSQDMRQIAIGLIQVFRQDGVERAPNVMATDTVLPYGPTGFQFPKFRVLISKLIPGNGYQFPNSSLSALERCSLHFMLSNTIDRRVRNDESTVCNQLSQYSAAMRVPRAASDNGKSAASQAASQYDNNFLADVELLENLKGDKSPSGGLQFSAGGYYPNGNGNGYGTGNGYGNGNGYGSGTNTGSGSSGFGTGYGYGTGQGGQGISQCPIEGGVMWTPWGSVSAGTVIAGIAAGLQPQTIQVGTLLQTFKRANTGRWTGKPLQQQQQINLNVDNRWAATLAGELSEVALLQGPMLTAGGQISLGASGAWNSTALPRYYFLSQNTRLEMTDPEIRGGLDGLILASNITNWKNEYSSMKLSQLLDMYYSTRGVFGRGVRACDRRGQFASVAPLQTMIAQTTAFSNVLDQEMQLRVTLDSAAISTFSTNAANALAGYVPQYLNDVSCYSSNLVPNEQVTWNTASDLYIFVDTTWQFQEINPIIMYFLQNMNVSPYASRMTVMNAMNGAPIVPTSQYITDAYVYWNWTTHQQQPRGLNLANVLMTIGNITQNLQRAAQSNATSGGRSLVALVASQASGTQMGPNINQASASYTYQQLQYLRTNAPDLKILFLSAAGTVTTFSNYAQSAKDVVGASTAGNVVSQTIPLILRVRDIPMALINYRCGPFWTTDQYGNAQMYQYVAPGSINFYRLLANYFFGGGSDRYISIQGPAAGTITVCSSRYIEHPTTNATYGYGGYNNNNNNGVYNNPQNNYQNDVNCTQLTSTSQSYTLYLNNPCSGYNRIMDCPPVYISVQGMSSPYGGSSASCTDNMCRFPDQLRYTVSMNNLGCYSSATRFIISSVLVFVAALFSYVFI